MERTEIDGAKVVHEFIVLWHRWECDGYGWITEDGRVWFTTHGSEPFEVESEELLERMEETLACATGLQKALAATTKRQKENQAEERSREPGEPSGPKTTGTGVTAPR